MAILENISVAIEDLEKIKPNISDLVDTNKSNIQDIIQEAKRQVYEKIRTSYKVDNPGYSEAEIVTDLALVKDYPEMESLKRIISHHAIADLYKQNGKYDDYEIWLAAAKGIPINFYVDKDSDDVVDGTEDKLVKRRASFSR